ncbi:MAG: adenylate/guanylate cyclase domain-containing protein [Planctomycetota bacterium]
MATAKEILDEVASIFATKWQTREGRKIPEAEDVQLGNDAVTLSGTVIYADLRDSTGLVTGFKDWFAAEVYKAYLLSACRLIRERGGQITAFDGDRVMAVFIGNSKNTAAAKTALHINWIVRKVNELLATSYPNTSYRIRHAVGIDTSSLFVARTGVRNSNDLVWVGRAANYAAKLCALATEDYPTFITDEVFKLLAAASKVGGNPPRMMWEKVMWPQKGIPVHRSNWWWEL